MGTMWHWPVGSIAVCCSNVQWCRDESLVFAAYNATVTCNGVQWTWQPPKIALSHEASWPHLMHDSSCPTQVIHPNGISIGSAVLQCSRMWSTDRHICTQIDRQRNSIRSNMPHLATTDACCYRWSSVVCLHIFVSFAVVHLWLLRWSTYKTSFDVTPETYLISPHQAVFRPVF